MSARDLGGRRCAWTDPLRVSNNVDLSVCRLARQVLDIVSDVFCVDLSVVKRSARNRDVANVITVARMRSSCSVSPLFELISPILTRMTVAAEHRDRSARFPRP